MDKGVRKKSIVGEKCSQCENISWNIVYYDGKKYCLGCWAFRNPIEAKKKELLKNSPLKKFEGVDIWSDSSKDTPTTQQK